MIFLADVKLQSSVATLAYKKKKKTSKSISVSTEKLRAVVWLSFGCNHIYVMLAVGWKYLNTFFVIYSLFLGLCFCLDIDMYK